MNQRERLKDLSSNFKVESLEQFFRDANMDFKPVSENLTREIEPDPDFIQSIKKLGDIEFEDGRRLVVVSSLLTGKITDKTSKKKQFDIGWKFLKKRFYDAGIFIFRDDRGHFRFSLIVTKYTGNKRTHTPFRRYTYYVHPGKANKTFINQIGKANFSGIDTILKAFSIDAVSDDFYNAFKPKFDEITSHVQGTDDVNLKGDFALLFVIRVIFIGFVQKRGWLGEREEFVQEFWKEYQQSGADEDTFYKRWLVPLFFEALNSQPGRQVKYRNNEFSEEMQQILQMAPYLNGELFKEKKGYDDQQLWIPDEQIGEFIEFLFQYNFTIEENTFYDEELELNPEFLGIIFERLVNKEDGAVYTPRTEVDFMCRMGLVKWLQKNSSAETNDLYHLFFRDRGRDAEYDEDQKQGDFTTTQIRELIELLSKVTVCDPAAGSGAFEVGMLHVLHDILDNLYRRHNAPKDLPEWDDFEQKKSIIARSLYGVEVKEWAVWINQLRLWLTLFIDMPDEYKNSLQPLLPSLNFKVRQGDSLVQRIGNKLFPVQGHAQLSAPIKRKITELKKAKVDFFYNRGGSYDDLRGKENEIFRSILDDEIKQKYKDLKGLTDPRLVQGDLLGSSGPKQGQLETDEKEKEKIKAEIGELEAQKKALGENHPLIWNIEFAEIFFDQGGFDVVIGNPPYLSKDDIADPLNNLKKSEYKKLLKRTIQEDFPDYFTKSVKISGRSDLLTYFYVKSLRLLNSNGYLIFISSNSWLDTGYGSWLQRFLLKKIEKFEVIDNHAKRSFSSADVNTVITVMASPTMVINGDLKKVKFIAFKKPFEECIIAENVISIESSDKVELKDDYRIYTISVEDLIREGSEFKNKAEEKLLQGKYVGEKWGGKYLRAPDFFIRILDEKHEDLIELKNLGEVNEGRPTGSNKYFFVEKNIAKDYEIEDKHLLNGLMKTRNKAFELLTEEDSDRYFLNLPKDFKPDDSNVSDYFRYGEKHVVPNSKTLQGKKHWWYFKNRVPADLIAPCGIGEKFFCAYNNLEAVTSNSYTEIRLSDKSHLHNIHRVINSPFGWLQIELFGRHSLGGGMLKFDPTEFRKFLIVKLEKNLKDKHLRRPIKSVFKECGINPESDVPISEQEPEPLPDRAELDNIVFDALGLTQEERKEVYRAVCQLVWNRVSKARSV